MLFVGAKNENSVRLAPEGSPLVKGALAVTVTTYVKKSGALLDADIVINGKHHSRVLEHALPVVKNAPGAYDLQNTLAHEVGHFLGLGENYGDGEATESHTRDWSGQPPGTRSIRSVRS